MAGARAAEAQRLASIAEQRMVAVDAVPVAPPPPALLPPPGSPAAAAASPADDATIARIAGYLRTSGILWLALGILQVAIGIGFASAAGLTLTLVVIGVWNIVAATARLNAVPLVQRREASVPEEWQGVAGLVVAGVVNLLIGGIIGVAFVIFDFVVRDHILRNRHLFTTTTSLVPLPPAT